MRIANSAAGARVSQAMRRATLVILPATLALVGWGPTAAGRPAGAPVASSSAKHATVKTRSGSMGTYLVDGRGRTLYLFRKDKTRRSTCNGACAQAWPPLTTRERPEAEGRAKQSRLSTSRRRNGAKQVVYNGHPLYRYAGDGGAGDVNGQGLNTYGGRWYLVAPSGKAITSSGSPSPYPY